MGSHPQQWSTLKWHGSLREITLLQLQLLPALTGESTDAPQLDYLWLATLYLFLISLRLHSAASFWLSFISMWLEEFFLWQSGCCVLHDSLCKPKTSAKLVLSPFVYCIRNNILNTFQMLWDNNINTLNPFIYLFHPSSISSFWNNSIQKNLPAVWLGGWCFCVMCAQFCLLGCHWGLN